MRSVWLVRRACSGPGVTVACAGLDVLAARAQQASLLAHLAACFRQMQQHVQQRYGKRVSAAGGRGILDSAVQGGLVNYELAFLTREYAARHPEHEALLQRLRDHIADQVPLLKSGACPFV
ncbi:jg24117, partial [Pararge aegeria aegeria]